MTRRSYAIEGYRRLVCLKAKKPKSWLVLSHIVVPSTKALARPQINASSPNIAILVNYVSIHHCQLSNGQDQSRTAADERESKAHGQAVAEKDKEIGKL